MLDRVSTLNLPSDYLKQPFSQLSVLCTSRPCKTHWLASFSGEVGNGAGIVIHKVVEHISKNEGRAALVRRAELVFRNCSWHRHRSGQACDPAAIWRLTSDLLCYIKFFMRTRIIASLQLALIFPAVLFMTALLLRSLQPQQYEPARSAQQVVLWYAARMWSLWILLLALPITVLVAGAATLLWSWNRDTALPSAARQLLAAIRSQWAMLVVAAATLTAGGILAIVVLHMLAD